MAIIPLAKINQFLPQEKLELSAADADSYNVPDLERTAWDIVTAKLHGFDQSEWSLPATEQETASVPSIIENVLGMLVAAWIYQRQFSEEASENEFNYGHKLEADAYRLLEGIINEDLVLGDVVVNETDAEFDAPSVYETEPVFTIGAQF